MRQRERQEQIRREKEADAKIRGEYHSAFDLWAKYEKNKRIYAPKSQDEDINPLYLEAVQNIDRAAYALELAEMRLRQYEHNRN